MPLKPPFWRRSLLEGHSPRADQLSRRSLSRRRPRLGQGKNFSSGWDRSKWSTLTAKNLGWSDYETDHEWHASAMRCGEGWAHDSTWNQCRRAKPTHTDPEDDVRVDSTMPVGATSKTWNPNSDDQFWYGQSGSEVYGGSSSQSSTQWRPRLRPNSDLSSVAGDASEGSAAPQRLGSIEENEGEPVTRSEGMAC